MQIDTSLLRERFIIEEHPETEDDKTFRFEAASARMAVTLQAGELPPEEYVVRACNMYSCARLIAQIVQDYEKNGPLMSRAIRVDWSLLWDNAQSDYDRRYMPTRWVAIYHKGKKLYGYGQYHSFLDVIEQCEMISKKDYDKSVALAKDAFKQAGKEINIQHESNVALIAILSRKEARCSSTVRGSDRTTTFTYTLTPLDDKKGTMNVTQGLSTAADFLEGIQLSFFVGVNTAKIELDIIKKHTDDWYQTRDARNRINALIAQIGSMENTHKIRYRPEKPDFDYLMRVAEKNADKHIVTVENDETIESDTDAPEGMDSDEKN